MSSKIFYAVVGSFLAVSSISAKSRASTTPPIPRIDTAGLAKKEAALLVRMNTDVQDLINWKVGDRATYSISQGLLGPIGTLKKSMIKDEGTSVWIRLESKIFSNLTVTEILFSKADGKILKLIRDGKETAVPSTTARVTSQDYDELTTPAGKFQAIHIVGKNNQGEKFEAWTNPRDTALGGVLKRVAWMDEASTDSTTQVLTHFDRMP